jgi:predicted nuclease of predicted toxin-antitoxin system
MMPDMKFLTDQNISPKTTAFLKDLGLDVSGVREIDMPEISDESLYAAANNQDFILITYDVDAASYFSTKRNLPGLILLRVQPQTMEFLHPALKIFFEKVDFDELQGNIAVINNQSYKIMQIR